MIKDGKPLSELEHLNQAARQMLDQMAWWTAAAQNRIDTTEHAKIFKKYPNLARPRAVTALK